jgi:hypothetical protein
MLINLFKVEQIVILNMKEIRSTLIKRIFEFLFSETPKDSMIVSI